MTRYYPSGQEFERLSADGATVPVYRRLLEDTLTPVSAFRKLAADAEHAFLLESVVGLESSARYSYLGVSPRAIATACGHRFRLAQAGGTQERESENPLQELSQLLQKHLDLRTLKLVDLLLPLVDQGSQDNEKWLPRLKDESHGWSDVNAENLHHAA